MATDAELMERYDNGVIARMLRRWALAVLSGGHRVCLVEPESPDCVSPTVGLVRVEADGRPDIVECLTDCTVERAWHPGPPPCDPDPRWTDGPTAYHHWRPVWVRDAGRPDHVEFWCYHVPEEWEAGDGWDRPRLFSAGQDYGHDWPDGALWREVR